MRILQLFGMTALCCCFAQADLAGSKPNIVMIIADDMAWDDCSVYGNKGLPTPNIDHLASEGMRFDRAFLTISSCSPSRASIISGRFPHQTDAEQLHWLIPKEQVTFTERLMKAGYWTASVGKFHMGDAMKDRFNVVKEADMSGFIASAKGEFKESAKGDVKSGATQWVETLRERPKEKPFFLWLSNMSDDETPMRCISANKLDHVVNALPQCVICKKTLRLLFKKQYKQRTDEWYQFRWNRITASSAWKILDSQANINQFIYTVY